MAISGPRLDRPSAIGDDGRSRAASLWLATLVVCVLVGVAGIAMGEPSLLVTLATVVGMAVGAIGLLERDQQGFFEQFGAHALLVTFGSATALLLVIAPFVAREGIAVSGFALALLGIGLGWANVGTDGLQRSLEGVAVTYASMLCVALVVSALFALGVAVWRGVAILGATQSPLVSVAGVLTVIAVTAAALLLALHWLPLVQLTRRDQRDRTEAVVATVRRLLVRTILVAFGTLVVVLAIGLAGWMPASVGSGTGTTTGTGIGTGKQFLVALSSLPVIGLPLAIAAASVCTGLCAVSLRWLTRQSSAVATRRSGALAVGIALVLLTPLWIVLFLASPLVGWLLALVLGIGPVVFMFLAATGVVTIWVGILPDRASGPAIAAVGLLVAAIGLGLNHPVLVFGCIAGAVLVWDLSTFGLGVTGELGHIPETRRLELVHGVFAIAIGAGAVLVATGLDTVRSGAFAGVGSTTAVALVALGAIVLLLPLRG